MKLTRQKLRRLIVEALEEAKYYIGDEKGNVESAIDAFHSGYTKDTITRGIARGNRDSENNQLARKAIELMDNEDPKFRQQGRELAHTLIEFGMLDDDILKDIKDSLKRSFVDQLELTDIEQTAFDMPFDKVEADRYNTEVPEMLVDKGALYGAMKSKSDGILSRFGFQYQKKLWIGTDMNGWILTHFVYLSKFQYF